MTQKDFEYWAFISYSHFDEKWGKWLHKKIERYRVPRKLVGKETSVGKVPKRLYPVFRDRDELPASSDLGAKLRQSLQTSRFLIVICSPHSAQSIWVNEEVKFFKALGRENRILCLILDGEPNTSDIQGKDKKECLPEVLRHQIEVGDSLSDQWEVPIAADLRTGKDGKRSALLKLVAGLLDIGYNILKKREKIRFAKKTIQFLFGFILLIFIGLALYNIQSESISVERLRTSSEFYLRKLGEASKYIKDGRPELAREVLWKAPEYLRNWEWGYLIYQCDLALSSFGGHSKKIDSAMFSPDGTRIVTTSNDNTPKVWDVMTGREQVELVGHVDIVYSARFSQDGTRIVTESRDGTMKFWNAITGRELPITKGIFRNFDYLAYSPDGNRCITADRSRTAKVWDVEMGTRLFELTGHTDSVNFATFSLDCKYIATTSRDHTAKVWDAMTGKEVLTLYGHTEIVYYTMFSPDGSRIFTRCRDRTGKVWNAKTGAELIQLSLSRRSPITRYVAETMRFNHNGSRIVWVSDDGVIIWNTITGQRFRLMGHSWVVYSASFSPDGKRIVTPSGDGTVRVWDTNTGKQLLVLEGHNDPVYTAEFSPDGTRIVTSSRDRTAKVWEANTGKELATLAMHGSVEPAKFSPDGTLILTISSDGTCCVWDATMIPMSLSIKADFHIFSDDACFSGDGSRVVTVVDNSVEVWDVLTGAKLITLDGQRFASFSPDGTCIVTGSSIKAAKIWDSETGKEVATLASNTTADHAVFSPSGPHIVVKYMDARAKVWDSKTGLELATLPGYVNHISSAFFSPDGTKIATTFFLRPVNICETKTGKELLVLPDKTKSASFAIFSPDGKCIATESNYKNLTLWDVETGTELLTIFDQIGAMFSPDGKCIVTTSQNGLTKVWELNTGRELASFGKIINGNMAMFSPDGKRIATAPNYVISIWDPATGMELATLSRGRFVSFSPDWMHIAVVDSNNKLNILHTAPFRKEQLPNNDLKNWQKRFQLWKLQRYQLWIDLHNQ